MIVGLAPGTAATTVAAVRDGALVSSWRLPAGPGPFDGLGRLVGGLGARAACVALDLEESELAPVAAIRVGGPCPEVLGPHPAHPGGAATIVRGGHSLTGRPLAALDEAAVRRFAAGCGLSDFAVTATGSPVLADHELAVAEIVAAEVPGARITLSYEFGRAGLREREEDAMLNAALGPAALRVSREVGQALGGLPLYFARTGYGVVSAHYFRRYPLICRFGATASLARGLAVLGGDSEEGAARAFGAALGQPVAEVERIVQARGRAELERALRDARDEALTRVVSAGAAPGSASIATLTVNPLSYLPHGLYRVRAAAGGATP
ncbi:hypothetical protein ACIBEJ_05525 [Nonomuraea sp. NPDC050790]|uniref:hypothetical protein n=1 Tax=Nonomuraea sp. NPDC050790 TaxID=3364371 RepID=UPI0037AFAE18